MTGKTLLRARKHHIGAELLHVEFVGNECANSVNEQSYAARPAEIGNQGHVVQQAGRCLMHIDEQRGNRIPNARLQHLTRDLLAEFKMNLVDPMTMQVAKIHEALSKATAVDHSHMFAGPKDVHDDGLHSAGARRSQKDTAGIFWGMQQIEHSSLAP